MTEWKIPRRSKECVGCGRVFEPGCQFTSALYEWGEGFRREDYCVECWKGRGEEGAVAVWRAKVPERDEKPAPLTDLRVLFNLFVRLQDAQERHKQNLAYFLALMLLRKKLLTLEDSLLENGKQYIIVKSPEEEMSFKLEVKELSEEEMELLKEDLSEILDSTL